jgi:dTMP kinase
MKGMFITFEGIEGCGKSTQSELLRDNLKKLGKEVILTREPGGTAISERIRQILLEPDHAEMLPETELLLYSASRSQHTGQKIIPSIKAGKIVISDRFYDSTIAYQGAARNIESAAIDFLCKFAAYHLQPDVTFLIDLPVKTGLSRIKSGTADRLEQESVNFHRKVRQGFLELAKLHKRIIIIDGQNTIEKINGLIMENIEKLMKERNS